MHHIDELVTEITPAMAKQWLALNTNNRNRKRTAIARYKRDMLAGVWIPNGDSISFNGDGSLVNGQNRLEACIEANVPFKAIVVTGLVPEAKATMDQGVMRTLSDVLTMQNINNARQVAGALRTGWRWDNGVLLDPVNPSVHEALQWKAENPSITSAVVFSQRLANAPLRLRISVSGPVYLKAKQAEGEAADEFFDRLLDGEHIAHGDAIYALRKALITNAMRTQLKWTQNQALAFLIKAWNNWLTQEPTDRLRWGRGRKVSERFPIMVDSAGNPISAEQ